MRKNKLQLIKERQAELASEAGVSDYAEIANPTAAPALTKLQQISQAANGETGNGPQGENLLNQLQAAMETDIGRLANIPVIEDKAKLKADLLENYLPFVSDYLQQGHNYPNSVAVQVMVWLFDIGAIEQGLMVGIALSRTPKQVMPERFRRNLPTFLADTIYDWANAQLKAEQSASPYLDQLVAVAVADKWDLDPVVLGKNMVMLAKHEFAKENYTNAKHWCEQAEAINPKKAGVKTLYNEILKKLDK